MQIIDLHCHSSLQPYSLKSVHPEESVTDPGSRTSLWFQDKARWLTKWIINNVMNISNYSQSDFTTARNASCQVLCVSLYPVEKGFAEANKAGLKGLRSLFKKIIGSLFTTLRFRYLDRLASNELNYFEELQREYHYYFAPDILRQLPSNYRYQAFPASGVPNPNMLHFIITIEGAHALLSGHQVKDIQAWENSLANIDTIKRWAYPPFFITLAHHYYNGLCTHAQSLFGMARLGGQQYGMRADGFIPDDREAPISSIGYRVIRALLSTQNGRRILIDVKHMSREARQAYYALLCSEYQGESIPVIISHGALRRYYNHQINVDEQDLLMVYQSKGLFGIEADRRVLGEKSKNAQYESDAARYSGCAADTTYLPYWLNMVSTAEWAWNAGFQVNPWGPICIGSDYDGIIDSCGNKRTAEDFIELAQALKKFLGWYWQHQLGPIPVGNADAVIDAILYSNALRFIQKHYCAD